MYFQDYLFYKRDEVEDRSKTEVIPNTWQKKPVKCVTTGQIFDSIQEAKQWANIKSHGSITAIDKPQKMGIHPETGEPLYWVLI